MTFHAVWARRNKKKEKAGEFVIIMSRRPSPTPSMSLRGLLSKANRFPPVRPSSWALLLAFYSS